MVQGQGRGGVEEKMGLGWMSASLNPEKGSSKCEPQATCFRVSRSVGRNQVPGPTSGIQNHMGMGPGICISTKLPSVLSVDRKHWHHP